MKLTAKTCVVSSLMSMVLSLNVSKQCSQETSVCQRKSVAAKSFSTTACSGSWLLENQC